MVNLGTFWKTEATWKQCYQTGQFQKGKNWWKGPKLKNWQWDILGDFQPLWCYSLPSCFMPRSSRGSSGDCQPQIQLSFLLIGAKKSCQKRSAAKHVHSVGKFEFLLGSVKLTGSGTLVTFSHLQLEPTFQKRYSQVARLGKHSEYTVIRFIFFGLNFAFRGVLQAFWQQKEQNISGN